MSQPCKRCHKLTTFDWALLCNCCWETEYRLEQYLQSPNGRAYAREALKKAEEANCDISEY